MNPARCCSESSPQGSYTRTFFAIRTTLLDTKKLYRARLAEPQ